MNKETKTDIISLTLAYIGVVLLSWWGFWSFSVHKMPFTHLFEFVVSGGGII